MGGFFFATRNILVFYVQLTGSQSFFKFQPVGRLDPLSSCSEYEDFTVTSNGEMQGVGMLIAADTKSGRLMVLSPLDGSPAARAGIQPGDEVPSRLLQHPSYNCIPSSVQSNEKLRH